jgi:hypothetical protein
VNKPFRDLSAIDIYKELIATCDRLDALAERAMSPATETALRTASRVIRRLSSALYKASF